MLKRLTTSLRPNAKGQGTAVRAGSTGTPQWLRQQGDAARDGRNWPAAAHYYGRLLAAEPDDAALWLQHGHMMKEVGLFSKARQSYDNALSINKDDPEAFVQLAIISKLEGKFQQAIGLYGQAITAGYQPVNFINEELAFLRKTSSRPPTWERNTVSGPKFYLSSVYLPVAEDNPANLKRFLGAAHYSYAYIMKGYQEALESAGYNCEVIRNPEYFPDIRTRSRVGPSIHIGFYPPESPRYLKGAHNIMCIAWEFERLKSGAESNSYHAFSDPATILSQAQEIWAISSYSAEAARRSGVARVTAVPTPVPTDRVAGRERPAGLPELQQLALKLDRLRWVPLAVWPNLQSQLSDQALGRKGSLLNILLEADEDEPPVLFLSIFNIHDYRKQVRPAIEAFVRFAQQHRNAFLLLKVSYVDSQTLDVNSMLLNEQLTDASQMTAPLVSDRILMTTDILSRAEMNSLYDIASYYLSTSHAEGQNLPLIEAMGRGVVPVSVDHTAMRDYISAENAVVIPSHFGPLTVRLTQRYNLYGVGTNYVDAADVLKALQRAKELSNERYAELSNMAVTTIKDQFGVTAFERAVNITIASVENGSVQSPPE